jgi:hypothetical protein
VRQLEGKTFARSLLFRRRAGEVIFAKQPMGIGSVPILCAARCLPKFALECLINWSMPSRILRPLARKGTLMRWCRHCKTLCGTA